MFSESINSSRNSATVCNDLSKTISIYLVPQRLNGLTSENNSIRKFNVSLTSSALFLLASLSKEITRCIPLLIPTSAAFGNDLPGEAKYVLIEFKIVCYSHKKN